MPDLKDIQSAWVAILFIMPGIWFDFGYRICVPRDEDIDTVRLLMAYFAVSCIWLPIYLLLSWLFGNSYWLATLAGSFIPALVGVVMGLLQKKGKVSGFLQLFGIVPTGIVRYAWNKQFLRLSGADKGVYIVVRFKNGGSVAGFYGGDSYAGLGMPTGDLFLEKAYLQTDDGLEEMKSSDGIWISIDSIETVEFLKSDSSQGG